MESRPSSLVIPGWVRTVLGVAVAVTVGYFVYHWTAGDSSEAIDGPAVRGTFHSDRTALTLTLTGSGWHDEGTEVAGHAMALPPSMRFEVYMRGDETPPEATVMLFRVTQEGAFGEFDDKLDLVLAGMQEQASHMGNGLFTLDGFKCHTEGAMGRCDGSASMLGTSYDAYFFLWSPSADDALFLLWFGHDQARDAQALVQSIQLD